MCLMTNIFNQYLDRFVFVFLDDILVYSKSEEEHEDHLRLILQVLQEHQFYARLKKCDFYQWKVEYLGHIISEEGIVVDLEKIKSILEWTTPRIVIEELSSMGLEGYYHWFMKIFSNIMHPITYLERKGETF